MSWTYLAGDLATCPPSNNLHCTNGRYGQTSTRRLGHRTNNVIFPDNYAFKDTLTARKSRHTNTPAHFPYLGKDSLRSLTNSRIPDGIGSKSSSTSSSSSLTKTYSRARPFEMTGSTAAALPPLRTSLSSSSKRLSTTELYRTSHTAAFKNVRLESVTTGSIPVFI